MARQPSVARAAVPLFLNVCRLMIGAAALIFALEANGLPAIAALIGFAIALAVLNAQLTVWLHAATPFSKIFDGLVDYLSLIVAPWALTRTLVAGPPRTALQEVLLDLPLLAGALRVARNSLLSHDRSRPGLDASFFAFVGVATVFLRLPEMLTGAQLSVYLIPAVAILSMMMIVTLAYPSVTRVPGLAIGVFIALVVAPFAQRERLTVGIVVFGALYVAVGHLLARDVSD